MPNMKMRDVKVGEAIMYNGEVWVIFQPHTTHRTAALLDEFARAFGDARHALILPIYLPSGRETAARYVGEKSSRPLAVGPPLPTYASPPASCSCALVSRSHAATLFGCCRVNF